MKRDDILYSALQISAISNIPIRIYEAGDKIDCFIVDNLCIDPFIAFEKDILSLEGVVSFYQTPFDHAYGVIRHKDFQIILGPIGPSKYSKQDKSDYAFKLGVNLNQFETLLKELKQIPFMPVENILHLILMINFYFNQQRLELKDIENFYNLEHNAPVNINLPTDPSQVDKSQTKPAHNSLAYERELLAFVKGGKIEELEHFISTSIHGNIGELADDNLRHYKNIFIVSTTLASRAAIEGGLFESEAMELSDMYINHCETLFSVDSIFKLQYQMLIDYTTRVSSSSHHFEVDPYVAKVANYIKHNLSSSLDTQSLSKEFHINRNQLTSLFKEELGVSPATYILNQRIKRAKFLLANTERPIIEISNYLGFSSQSHFQTKFKSIVGKTPSTYRKEHKKGTCN